MQDIQEKAMLRYAKNIEYISLEHFSLYQKILKFEENIEKGITKEEYSLEYKNGYFDVLQLKSGSFLYQDNSITLSQKLTSKVNFKRDSYLFDGFPMYKDYEKEKETFNDKTKGAEGIYPIMSYYLEHISPDSSMKEIEKFIFIGVGLGLHIIQIDKKISAEEYFIIEDDLELFRLSLFTTPYYKLGKKIRFSIAENKDDFSENFNIFLEISFFRNKYLKYSYFPAHSDEKIKLIKNSLASQAFSSFPYKTLLEKYTRELEYIKEKYNFINLSKQFQESSLSEKPFLILAAGPSFSENIEWLIQNHQHYIIVAVSALLNKLHALNIQADIVTHLDGFNASIEHLKSFNTKNKYLKNSVLLAGCFTPQEVLEKFSKKNIFIYEEFNTSYHDGFDSITGPCVGSTTIIQAIFLNIKNIYTLGVDLALAKDGHSHTSSHALTKTKYDTATFDTLSSDISFRGNFFKVQGNRRESVYTTPLFYGSLKMLNLSLPNIKNSMQNIYNLSDGAYIETTISLTTEELNSTTYPVLNKEHLHKEIINIFNLYAEDTLFNDDIISLKKRVLFAQEVKEVIKRRLKDMPLNRKELFLHRLISLMLDILLHPTRENRNLIAIYESFFNYAMPIIFDFFNTKDLKNEKEAIKELCKLLFAELFEIEQIYEKRIESFLKERC